MTRTILRVLLALMLGLLGFLRWPAISPAQADTCDSGGSGSSGDTCVNSGDSDAEADQEGSSESGDAVGGQTVGTVSDGDASIDATNRSDDVDVTTGDASGSNTAEVDAHAGVIKGPVSRDVEFSEEFSELLDEIFGPGFAEFLEQLLGTGSTCTSGGSGTRGDLCVNVGDADATTNQSADSTSGDGVAGQVVGLVTSRRGRANLVLSNISTDSVVASGNAEISNTSTTDATASALDSIGFVATPK
jgi:hypothetical protein